MVRPILTCKLNRETVLAVVVLIVILGSLALSFIDPTTRPLFADLSKITVSAYVGFRGGKESSK